MPLKGIRRLRDKLTSWTLVQRDRLCAVLPPQVGLRVRWPLAQQAPWKRKAIALYSRGGGVGDELMCTAVFRAIREANPECEITFHTRYPDLFRGHPDLAHTVLLTTPAGREVIQLRYDSVLPPKRALARLMGECVGLADITTTVVLPKFPLSQPLRERLAGLPRPWVLAQPGSSGWTPNKQWPLARWKQVLTELSKHGSVLEVGGTPMLDASAPPAPWTSLCGSTSLTDLAALMSEADLFLGPPSSGMHFASAYGLKSVILYGGYELPEGYGYPNVIPFGSTLPCANCWLTTACPIDRACLQGISVADVLSAATQALNEKEKLLPHS